MQQVTAKSTARHNTVQPADNMIRFAILRLRSRYPRGKSPSGLRVISLATILNPFLAHVLGYEHMDTKYVLRLVDETLWNSLVVSARLSIVSQPDDQDHIFHGSTIDEIYEYELERFQVDLFELMRLFPPRSVVISRLLNEIMLPLLFVLLPNLSDEELVFGEEFGRTGPVKVYRKVDDITGIEVCYIRPVKRDDLFKSTWCELKLDAKGGGCLKNKKMLTLGVK